MNKNPVIIMLSYARSGGTLLNRCISCLPDVVMLSEVNVEALCPSSCNTIKEQVFNWYGITLKSEGFMDNIIELYDYCSENNKILIIRDWSFGSFVPSRYNNFQPSKKLATLEAISKYFPVKSFAFVRDPVDVWLSLKSSSRTFYDTRLEYLYEFISLVVNNKIKFFRYEDLCANPEETMRKLLNHIGVEYSEQFKNFSNYYNVTGDIDLPEQSRGIKKGEISPLLRRQNYNEFADEIIRNTKALDIEKLLGY